MARYTVHTAAGRKRKTIYGKTRAEVAEKLAKAVMDRADGLGFAGGQLEALRVPGAVADRLRARYCACYHLRELRLPSAHLHRPFPRAHQAEGANTGPRAEVLQGEARLWSCSLDRP